MAARKDAERRPWTDEEIIALKKFSERKAPVKIIAQLMKRSEDAIRQKAWFLGLAIGERATRREKIRSDK